MSEEQLKAFWEATQADSALQQKLQGVTDLGAIVDIAKEAGFTISVEELEQAQKELSDEQLDGATGGLCVIFTHR
tara:strand:- start:434 stop:658 length:225 start_codon:yes stop_codon:yes gene_type:complete